MRLTFHNPQNTLTLPLTSFRPFILISCEHSQLCFIEINLQRKLKLSIIEPIRVSMSQQTVADKSLICCQGQTYKPTLKALYRLHRIHYLPRNLSLHRIG